MARGRIAALLLAAAACISAQTWDFESGAFRGWSQGGMAFAGQPYCKRAGDPQMPSTFQLEWDDAKAADHVRKHGITFELASTVFFDPNLLTVADIERSDSEDVLP